MVLKMLLNAFLAQKLKALELMAVIEASGAHMLLARDIDGMNAGAIVHPPLGSAHLHNTV